MVRGNVGSWTAKTFNHQAFLVFHSSNFKEVPTPQTFTIDRGCLRNTPPTQRIWEGQCRRSWFPRMAAWLWVSELGDKTLGTPGSVASQCSMLPHVEVMLGYFRVWAGQGAGWVFSSRSSSPASPYSGVDLDPWKALWLLQGLYDPLRDGTQTEPRREEGGYIQGSSTSPVATNSANMERTLRRAPRKIFYKLFWLDCQLIIQTLAILNTVWGSHLAGQGTVQY